MHKSGLSAILCLVEKTVFTTIAEAIYKIAKVDECIFQTGEHLCFCGYKYVIEEHERKLI